MKNKQKKSVRFRELLPRIYEKMIIDNYSHYQTAVWLKEECDLDLLGADEKGKPFSNYLSLYGDIKTAKHSYEVALNKDKTLQAKTWFQPFVDNEQLKSKKRVEQRIEAKADIHLDETEEVDSNSDDFTDNEVDVSNNDTTSNKVSVKSRYNIKPKTKKVPDDPFAGFDANAL